MGVGGVREEGNTRRSNARGTTGGARGGSTGVTLVVQDAGIYPKPGEETDVFVHMVHCGYDGCTGSSCCTVQAVQCIDNRGQGMSTVVEQDFAIHIIFGEKASL